MRTDSQRVEATLLPMLMMDVLLNGAVDPDHPDVGEAKNLLWLATREVIMDMPEQRQRKLMRRTKRTHDTLLASYKEAEARVDKVGLLVFYVLQAVTDCDYMVLPMSSPLSRAMDLMLPALAPTAEIEKLNASARKGARKALKTLQTLGYFEGVEMQD